MLRLALALALVGFVLPAFSQQPHVGHDIYRDLYPNGAYRGEGGEGVPCCGDDPIHGDCEPVGDKYRILANGDAVMQVKRYGNAEVTIPAHRILWMTIRGGQFSEAHWCGKPRAKFASGAYEKPSEEQPDPAFWTYCATIIPGGV